MRDKFSSDRETEYRRLQFAQPESALSLVSLAVCWVSIGLRTKDIYRKVSLTVADCCATFDSQCFLSSQ